MSAPPIHLRYEGEGEFRALRKQHADREYVVGEIYNLGIVEDRSLASHNHLFAEIDNTWETLRESLSAEFPSKIHLRKRALIEMGFYLEDQIACASPEEARKLVSMMENDDEFAAASIFGNLVVRRCAMSFKMRGRGAMGKRKFQEVKDALLAWCANLLGVTPEELQKAEAA